MCKIGTCEYCVNAIIKQEYINKPDIVEVKDSVTCYLDDQITREIATYKLDHKCHHVSQ